jgi:hypothetical protein
MFHATSSWAHFVSVEQLKMSRVSTRILYHWSKRGKRTSGDQVEKMVTSPKGNEKNLKLRNHIFRLCHRDKTSTYSTYVYHPSYIMLLWYTINLNRQIFSFWSLFNNDIM